MGDFFGGITDFLSDTFGGVVDTGLGMLGNLFGGGGNKEGNSASSLLDWIKGLAPGVGAVAGYAGQSGANEMNRDIARENNVWSADQARINREFQDSQVGAQRAFNSGEAQKARDFEERMSGSSYQRAVGDMQKANLNPILALMKGGASTPGGSAASSGSASGSMGSPTSAHMESVMSAAVSSAMSASQTAAMMARLEPEITKVRQDTRTSASSAAQMDAQAELLQQQRAKVSVEIDNLLVERRKLNSEADIAEFDAKKLRPAALRLLDVDARLKELEVPGAIARSRRDDPESVYGAARPYGEDALRVLNSVVPNFGLILGRRGAARGAARSPGAYSPIQ